ncbi:helix-turn-helix domain-containing protein [Yersinia hibernica]|uniref:Helix-turn-helix domain-containing protein n=1 Tax=Yersinia hibernica TaxID=2339259 RepID=A0ABX5R3Z3_9GAMM|nr:helix-turn-helix domain-containing protein [Yersinia hibernica]QAX80382.1 helix-turn-helix domain-containing protein [Yersinia hibernica]
MAAINNDIKPIIQSGHCLSLEDSLVLAIPKRETIPLRFRSVYSDKSVMITEPSLFICTSPCNIEGDKTHWLLHSITIAKLIELLATIDSAMGKSLLDHSGKKSVTAQPWAEVISINVPDGMSNISVNNIVIDLILRNQVEFNTWCEMLRRYEAYGIMCFILSSSEQKDNVSINYLSQRYGVSSAYFRQLYRENFQATAKKKMMRVRMASAVLQLIESEDSILEVGLDAGYCSASHFTNDLKKELGLTPSEIRRLESILYEN